MNPEKSELMEINWHCNVCGAAIRVKVPCLTIFIEARCEKCREEDRYMDETDFNLKREEYEIW